MGEKIFDIKERTYKFSLDILNFSNLIPGNLNNQVLLRQLIRSATSVGANVTEGQAGSSKKDFINYYLVALKSANETIYWLNLIKDTNNGTESQVINLLIEIKEIASILGKIVVNCKK